MDQAAVASLVTLALVGMVAYWFVKGGHRGELIEIDRAEPLAVGARFEVITSYMGRESTLVYETVEIEPPRRVVLRAETGAFTSLDTMTFDLRPGGGTLVTYDADLAMRGLARLAELPMRLAFRRIGDAARDGLRTRLAEAPPRVAAGALKTAP